MRSALDGVRVCPRAIAREGEIPIIDDSTPFSVLVSLDTENPSCIEVAGEEICTLIDELMDALAKADYGMGSPASVLVGATANSPSVSVKSLPYEAGTNHLFSEQPSNESVELFVSSQMRFEVAPEVPLLARQSSIDYNEERIRREIVFRLLGWVRVSVSQLRTTLPLAVDHEKASSEIESVPSTPVAMKNNAYRVVVSQQMGMSPLHREMAALRSLRVAGQQLLCCCDVPTSRPLLSAMDAAFTTLTRDELIRVANCLIQMILWLRLLSAEDPTKRNIDVIGDDATLALLAERACVDVWFVTMLKAKSRISIAYFHYICELVRNSYARFHLLYPDVHLLMLLCQIQ